MHITRDNLKKLMNEQVKNSRKSKEFEIDIKLHVLISFMNINETCKNSVLNLNTF